MEIIFLGTNGWYDTETGNTPSVLIETEDNYIVCDAGFGFYKLKKYITSDKPIRLFISHLHYDHIIGLHTLGIFKFKQGIDIYIHKKLLTGLRAFLKRPFTSPPMLLPTKIRFRGITETSHVPVNFKMAKLRHSTSCYGYSFNVENKKISYCTDTGLCGNLKKLAKNADFLITECSMSPGEKSLNLFHMTPETAAAVARDTGTKQLALIHFDPGKYPLLSDRKKALYAAKLIFTNTIVAEDNMTVML